MYRLLYSFVPLLVSIFGAIRPKPLTLTFGVKMPHTKIECKHIACIAIRKSLIVTLIWFVCYALECHHVFAQVGKTGELVIGSFVDHCIFDIGN
jgi:hypothetical protein